jgi:hypothetical protein
MVLGYRQVARLTIYGAARRDKYDFLESLATGLTKKPEKRFEIHSGLILVESALINVYKPDHTVRTNVAEAGRF